MKIAFIAMHPAPYRDSFIGTLIEQLHSQIDVFNLFAMDEGHDFWMLRHPNYKTTNLNAHKETWLRDTLKLLGRFVFSRRYDFVMWPGWTYKCLMLPIFASAVLGVKYGFVADTIEQRKIGKIALWIKRMIVQKARIVFVPGMASERFFQEEFGIDKCRIVKGAYSLDGVMLEQEILSRKANRRLIRERLGIGGDSTMFLMVANMTPNRCYPITVNAFIKASEANNDIVLVVVGKGPDLPIIQNLAARNKCIRVVPGCAFDEMLSLFAAADIYVHGGTEPASTALVIGAIAHLPLVSSQAVGCSADVLVNMETGLQVENYKDQDLWTRRFQDMISYRSEWKKWGDAARERSKALDVATVVKSFVDVISNA